MHDQTDFSLEFEECQRVVHEKVRWASSGPRTAEGKRIASMNALKSGLTGRTVLLPGDDAQAYEQHLAAYAAEYRPLGLRETELVQSLADTQWRLARIPGLEFAIYARGRREFAELYTEQDLATRISLIDLDVHLKYERQLRNLQLQESRLHRRFEKERAELRQLQNERKEAEPKPPVATAAAGREFVFSNHPPTHPARRSAAPVAAFSTPDRCSSAPIAG